MDYSKRKMKNVNYFSVFGFESPDKSATYSSDYIRRGNAEKEFNRLIKSGKYCQVMMRYEEVFLRDEDNELSNSSPFKTWKNGKIETYNCYFD